MDNPLFDSQTRKRLRDRAALLTSARKELNRITSASLTTLKSNFKSPEELEETIKKLEKQLTSTAPNKTRLTGARKRVTNMRTRVTGGGGFRRAGLIAMAATKKNNNGLESHPLKKREKTPAVNVNLGSFFESAEAAKAAKNITTGAIASVIKKTKNTETRRARERIDFNKKNKKKYRELIESGETISNSNRKRIDLLYNNLAKKLNKRNAAEKKEASEKKTAANANAAASKRTELEKVLTRLEKLNTPYAIKLYNTISNNNKQILNTNENLSNRYKSVKQQINNSKAGEKMTAFVQDLEFNPKKRLGIFNRGKAFLTARVSKKADVKPPPPSFNEATTRNALRKYLNATVKPTYNKALMNAILKLPEMNNNTRRRIQSPRMYALQRGASALGRGAVTAGGALGRGAVTAGGALGRGAVTAGGALGRGAVTAGGALGRGAGALGRGFFSRSATPAAAVPAMGGGFFSRLFAPKPPPSFIPFKKGMKIPLGYVLKKNNKGLGYYKNNKALASQLEHSGYGPAPKPTGTTSGISVGVGSGPTYRYGNRYENRYGNRYNRGGPGAGGGIVFAPKINVGAARIGAQTFGGTRVGGQQMGGSRVRTGNTGSTTLKTGNTGGTFVKTGNTGNAGRLAVSAPTSSGSRQLAATSEQLIRGAGGAEAVDQGIKALNAANGNVARAKAMSKLPNNTFTNIYAMGGPVAAKRLVESRRRRRTVGGRRVASKKKRVARKPKKQYIKLTPYQFKRLTDHIKKNNLRKVLIKEITH
jgi:hypothetical protein